LKIGVAPDQSCWRSERGKLLNSETVVASFPWHSSWTFPSKVIP